MIRDSGGENIGDSEGDEEKSATNVSAPRITIGITCFNAAPTVERAISSAFAQDWPVLDIVIVDDCSTDGSADVIRKALAGHPNARLLQHSANRGAAAARNTLIEAAKGDFIVFFDDDDESAVNRVTVQYEALQCYEKRIGVSLVACYASGAREYPNGYRKLVRAIGSKPRPPVGLEVVDYLLVNDRRPDVFYGGGTPTCALMVRTATLRAAGGFDVGLRRVEDVDLAIRLGFLGAHFIGCCEQLYLQYATVGSDKTPARNLEAELGIVDKYRAYLEGRGLYHYAREWFLFRFHYFSRNYAAALLCVAAIFLRYPVRTISHLWRSAPARLRHERAMSSEARLSQ